MRIGLPAVELDKVADEKRLPSCAATKGVPLFQETEGRSGYAEELPKCV
jgi:hypothetical protein